MSKDRDVKPSNDPLTTAEREALELCRKESLPSGDIRVLVRALDRLAPKPTPPLPRVRELPVRWVEIDPEQASAYDTCAAELVAALQGERERRFAYLRGVALRAKLADAIAPCFQRAPRSLDVLAAADAVQSFLMLDRELEP